MVQVMEVSPEARMELERMARSSVLPHRKVAQAPALLEIGPGRGRKREIPAATVEAIVHDTGHPRTRH